MYDRIVALESEQRVASYSILFYKRANNLVVLLLLFSKQDILFNRSIKDALVAEEKFFRTRPVYNSLTDRCGVPQLAKKLNQILVQHIKAILPGLKSCISSALVSVAKEHASYGEITESKAAQGALLLNILSKYCEAFSSMVEGKNEQMSTSELSGGARIHYIFQSIFVKSLEDVDPCEGLTDDDIRTAIQNATGPRSALFVPEVPFEVLVRRQIARLIDPSLQCARFIYDELIKISHRCMMNELRRFPVLRKHMDQVIGNFHGLEPSETMIGHIIEMEMDYINTSHPNFIGGSKAVEFANQQIKNSRVLMPVSKAKDGLESDKAPTSERSTKSRAIIARQVNGIAAEQVVRPAADVEKVPSTGSTSGSTWGISSIFVGNDNHSTVKEVLTNKPYTEPAQNIEHSFSMIHLREPPTLLRPSECSETEAIEIAITKLLLRSHYDIVRKNIEDSVPKAIMHFLVNHSKRELHNVFIRKLYRENLFEEMLQEPDEIASKRKRTREILRVLQQAFRTLDELPLEAETVERGYSLGSDPTGLPKIHGLPTSSMYSTSSGSNDSYETSPKISKSRVSSHLGELQPHLFGSADSNGNRRSYLPGLYPTVDL
ncbi:dynamin-related protein 3A-like [Hibiscus syriacus]|uniref:dynamin-related protein 3A-like n=1 Tax=Hibiscus syriacus TaxID=106335 RepID=UPI0019241111|nr:dynamin-related protein 3A-like [Hibiscus syriacus]